jgi:alkylated DNA repair protein (DNA oxidative demethylase)
LPRIEGLSVLEGFALPFETLLCNALAEIIEAAPLRHMITPGGFRMSVAMTNCGLAGWVTDRKGYQYTKIDPDSGKAWPAMPGIFANLATSAAASAGFFSFKPDACLINSYAPGARMSLHQDRNERDFTAPIVSVSLGLSARFLFGGSKRGDRPARFTLKHGDVAVWGGPVRMNFHGIMPLEDGEHPLLGRKRLNLTFRQAL